MLRQGFDNDSDEYIIEGFKESAEKFRNGTYQAFDEGIEKGFDTSLEKGAERFRHKFYKRCGEV